MKGYFTIDEICEQYPTMRITPIKLRRWKGAGLLSEPVTDDQGKEYWSDHNQMRMATIMLLLSGRKKLDDIVSDGLMVKTMVETMALTQFNYLKTKQNDFTHAKLVAAGRFALYNETDDALKHTQMELCLKEPSALKVIQNMSEKNLTPVVEFNGGGVPEIVEEQLVDKEGCDYWINLRPVLEDAGLMVRQKGG